MNVYICVVCGFIHDEAAGRPEDGIAPGTPWAEVPAGWRCPECNVGKADFTLVPDELDAQQAQLLLNQ